MQTTRIRFREDTALNWRIANPILASSEPGRETDTGKFKLGDGTTTWNNLPYATSEGNVTVENTEVLNTLNVNQTETNSNFNSIQSKLSEIETLLRQTPEQPTKSFDEQLAEMGYCMVTYITDSGTITEMNKIGEFYNHMYYDKHIEQREIFMGYSLSADSTEVITSVPGKCTLYPVYVKAPDTPININIATTLDGWWNCTTDELIYESIGRNINGLNQYGLALAGFSLDANSLTSINNFDSIEEETTFYGPVVILGYDKIIRTVNEADEWYNIAVNGRFYNHPVNLHLLNDNVINIILKDLMHYYEIVTINNIEYRPAGWSIDTGIDNVSEDTFALMNDPNTENITDLYMVYSVENFETGETSLKNAAELDNLYHIRIFTLTGGDVRIKYSSLDNYSFNYSLNETDTLIFEGYSLNEDETGDNIVIYSKEYLIENNIKIAYCVYSFKDIKYNYLELRSTVYVNTLGWNMLDYPIVLLQNYSQPSFTIDDREYQYLGLSKTPFADELVTNFNQLMWYDTLHVIMTCNGEPISYDEACEAFQQYNNSLI